MSLIRTSLVILAAVPVPSGCTESIEVLTTQDAGTHWTDCARALKEGRSGERCQDFQVCVTRSPDGCCSRLAECKEGVLTVHDACLPNCPASCGDDSACLFGREWCTEGVCTACQPPPEGCFDNCPRGWLPRMRNGCYTCECVPPSECHKDAECGPGLRCYAGRACPSGCTPGDPSCCEGNFCSQAGCTEPAPGAACASGAR